VEKKSLENVWELIGGEENSKITTQHHMHFSLQIH
jgi:hypothetical protein